MAGAIYGATFFGVIVEAGTAPLGIPFAVLVGIFGLAAGTATAEIPASPRLLPGELAGFSGSFSAWAIYWGGLPQFSELGLIK